MEISKKQMKQPDQFVSLTEKGVSWAEQNRRLALGYTGAAVVLILIIVGSYMLYDHRASAASTAFGEAMHTYQMPVASATQPLPPDIKSFPSEAERARAANAQFVDVANRYGMTKSGKMAQYFAGLTFMEEGQNGSAEDALKKVAGSWDSNIAALGKLGLAQLYQQTSRNDQAAELYSELAKGKADTVPPGLAQIQLAEMYSAEGKQDKAREIYAKLKDSDKDAKGNPGAAGALAAEKLNPAAQQQPALQ